MPLELTVAFQGMSVDELEARLWELVDEHFSGYDESDAYYALRDVSDSAFQPGYPGLPEEAIVAAARKHLDALARWTPDDTTPTDSDFTSASVAMRAVKDTFVARRVAPRDRMRVAYRGTRRRSSARSRRRRVVTGARRRTPARPDDPEPPSHLVAQPGPDGVEAAA
jgi:hypothetical protein